MFGTLCNKQMIRVDKIVLAGMEFYAYHGVFDEENTLGARFVVDVELSLPLPEVDVLSRTVNYGAVYDLVRGTMQGERYKLIEALAHRVAARLLSEEPLIHAALVRVHKPNAPLPGVVRDVFVEVTRYR